MSVENCIEGQRSSLQMTAYAELFPAPIQLRFNRLGLRVAPQFRDYRHAHLHRYRVHACARITQPGHRKEIQSMPIFLATCIPPELVRRAPKWLRIIAEKTSVDTSRLGPFYGLFMSDTFMTRSRYFKRARTLSTSSYVCRRRAVSAKWTRLK